MNDLLLEIGTEEIPAGYIEPALKALSSNLLQKLSDARIGHGRVTTYGTPKRLCVKVEDVADKQKSQKTEITGPPEKVGFDEDGSPTMAAIKFAEKLGASVKKIRIVETKKGKYLSLVKTEPGLLSKTVLKSILPEAVLSIPFPKTMRWGALSIEFARPIQWVMALLGSSVVSFPLGDLKSGRYTYGHRFMHPKKIKIKEPGEYNESLQDANVIPGIAKRKEFVVREISDIAMDLGGKVSPDSELVDIVTNLVEYPFAVAGKFDTKFLELPKEVLITAMREHQKYFAVLDSNDNLMPCFIAVNNTSANNMTLVAKGHERVLRARLEDAMFFYKSDLKVSLENMVEKLKKVMFQAELGSVYEKITRVQKLAKFLSEALDNGSDDNGSDEKSHILRAAFLCKADLVSKVVVEFTKLQGIMGRVYATKAKEHKDVALAIEEHYRPTYSGGPLPETIGGAILSMADKIDSICGCFGLGLIPTGTSDPYALRRQGIGIVQIILDQNLNFSLRELISRSVKLFGKEDDGKVRKTSDLVYTFLQNRISHLLAEEGFSKDIIASVTTVSVDNVPDVWQRVQALEKLKGEADFEPLAIAFKRAVNIIKKAGHRKDVAVDENLFEDVCESDLLLACSNVKSKVTRNLSKGDFDQALLDIASLRCPVDAFFDGVLVMAEDEKVRNNRLALLGKISGLFENIADFSKIGT
jgi:glycyl-tRNA synthetase beta chain